VSRNTDDDEEMVTLEVNVPKRLLEDGDGRFLDAGRAVLSGGLPVWTTGTPGMTEL